MRPHAPPYLKACSSCRAKCSSRSGVAPPDCAAESAVRRASASWSCASASWPCASASWPRSLQHSSARRVAPDAAGHAPEESLSPQEGPASVSTARCRQQPVSSRMSKTSTRVHNDCFWLAMNGKAAQLRLLFIAYSVRDAFRCGSAFASRVREFQVRCVPAEKHDRTGNGIAAAHQTLPRAGTSRRVHANCEMWRVEHGARAGWRFRSRAGRRACARPQM